MVKKSSEKKTIDVLSHSLNPEMSVLSESEKAKLLKKYSVSDSQLPVIPAADPVAVALKANPGDIIQIKRKEETGEYTSYRIVV